MTRMAYYTNASFYDPDSGLYSVAVIEEHVAGWTPHRRQFSALADAVDFAKDGNDSRFHLSPDEVVAIVASSIGAQNAARSRVRDEDAIDAIAHAIASSEWDAELVGRLAAIVKSTGRWTITDTEPYSPSDAEAPGDGPTVEGGSSDGAVTLPTEQSLRDTWLQR